MTPAVLLLLALAAPTARSPLVSVRMETATDGRSVVVVRLPTAETRAVARREGTQVIVALPGGATVPVALPEPKPPVLEMALERPSPGGDRLVLLLPAPWDFEEKREGRELRLVFASRPVSDDVEALAQMLFPAGSRTSQPLDGDLLSSETMRQGPRVRLRPTVSASYSSGNNGFEAGPRPQDDSYFEAIPKIEAVSGPLRVAYLAYLRAGSSYADANTTTQSFDARFERQLASDTHLEARYLYLDGRQQASEVDPGGEYFYGYQPFRKQQAGADSRIPIGGATSVVLGGAWSQVRFDQAMPTFTDYSAWGAHGGLRRDLGGQSSVELQYMRDDVYDASDANVRDAVSDTGAVALTSELRPMLNVHLVLGLTHLDSPGAPADAQSITDWVGRAEVRRQFSESTALELGYQRSHLLSAFEQNPNYRTNFFEVRGHAPLPWQISLAGSLEFRRNSYPLPAAGIGEPRQDDIWGWTAGIGRSIGSHAVAHAEYRWQRRDSNLPLYSSSTHSLVIQIDIDPLRKGSGQ